MSESLTNLNLAGWQRVFGPRDLPEPFEGESFPCYQCQSDGTFRECLTDEIGRAPFLILHPDTIAWFREDPSRGAAPGWYFVPSTTGDVNP